VRIEDIAYDVDGVQMVGHLATDDTRPGRRPAVLVCHEGPGLDEHAKRRAEMLAELGYVAFALDFHSASSRAVPTTRSRSRDASSCASAQRTH
jgi:dienelactone hydrolase